MMVGAVTVGAVTVGRLDGIGRGADSRAEIESMPTGIAAVAAGRAGAAGVTLAGAAAEAVRTRAAFSGFSRRSLSTWRMAARSSPTVGSVVGAIVDPIVDAVTAAGGADGSVLWPKCSCARRYPPITVAATDGMISSTSLEPARKSFGNPPMPTTPAFIPTLHRPSVFGNFVLMVGHCGGTFAANIAES
jgi:hypothetical protein